VVDEAMGILNNPMVSLFLPAWATVVPDSAEMDAWAERVVNWFSNL